MTSEETGFCKRKNINIQEVYFDESYCTPFEIYEYAEL
jgi:hypothetical protein